MRRVGTIARCTAAARCTATGLAAAAALLVPAALSAACSSSPSPQGVAQAFLTAWASRDWPAMRALVATRPADFGSVNAAALSNLGASRASYDPGRLAVTGSTAREPVTERIPVTGVGTVTIKQPQADRRIGELAGPLVARHHRAADGHGNPLPTDAWLIGFNNDVSVSDVAFAMVTVDGGEGGPTDGPIVAKFLDLLRRSGH